jgi:hypothetical protein
MLRFLLQSELDLIRRKPLLKLKNYISFLNFKGLFISKNCLGKLFCDFFDVIIKEFGLDDIRYLLDGFKLSRTQEDLFVGRKK